MPAARLRSICVGALALVAAAAGAEPVGIAEAGRPPVVWRTELVPLADGPVTADLYYPAAMIPRALVLIAHGFTRSRARHADLAHDLARAGFAVAVPDLPHGTDQAANARSLVLLAGALGRARAGPSEPGSAALPVVYAGFSAGGATALIAAAADPEALGWIGLDPVGRGGLAAEAAARLGRPAYVFHAPANPCNAHWNASGLVARLTRVAVTEVPFSSHCDFEGPTDVVCELACGAADPGRQAAVRTAVVEAAEALVARGGRRGP